MITDLRRYQPRLTGKRLLIPGRPPLPAGLEEILDRSGIGWDRTDSACEARQIFFAWGGHDGLLVPPFTGAGQVRATTLCLRHIDPDLPVLTFLDPAVLRLGEPQPHLLGSGELKDQGGRSHLLQRILTILGG
jgi:hypothetical protein